MSDLIGGSVVECLTRGRGAADSSLTDVTALCPWARHINPSLVLVQPRTIRPYITERLLMGRQESSQTNEQISDFIMFVLALYYFTGIQSWLIWSKNRMDI